MNTDDFDRELQLATSMRDGAKDSLYWCGYRRGLLQARFGRRMFSHDNHFAWRAFKEDDDPLLAELGRGYLDGLNTVINGKPTRPAVQTEPSSATAKVFVLRRP
jgi:hypothetical protein